MKNGNNFRLPSLSQFPPQPAGNAMRRSQEGKKGAPFNSGNKAGNGPSGSNRAAPGPLRTSGEGSLGGAAKASKVNLFYTYKASYQYLKIYMFCFISFRVMTTPKCPTLLSELCPLIRQPLPKMRLLEVGLQVELTRTRIRRPSTLTPLIATTPIFSAAL